MLSPMEILSAILNKPTAIDQVRSLVTPDVTYVSLKIMPWCGTSRGPESIVKTFVDVGRYWQVQAFRTARSRSEVRQEEPLETPHPIIRWAGRLAIAGFLMTAASRAEEPPALPDFKPVPPAIKARILPVDPQKGYLVKELKPSVYLITDGGYQSMFVTTGKGVILLDAPPSYGTKIVRAVSEVTSEPIVELVYSHSHLDHISGAADVLKAIPNVKIMAENGVAEFLREKRDPRRPIPTATFKDHLRLTLGSATIELRHGHWHSNEGDLYIYLPSKKVLMAIDRKSVV